MEKIIFILFFVFLDISWVFSFAIYYTGDTLPDNSFFSDASISTEVGIEETTLQDFVFYENGEKYGIYDSGLVFFFNFDKRSTLGETNSIIKDLSPYGHTSITLRNTPSWISNGKHGGAYNFNDIDLDVIEVQDTNDLLHTQEVSVSAWVNVNDRALGAREIISRGRDKRGFTLRTNPDGYLQFYVGDGNGYFDGDWYGMEAGYPYRHMPKNQWVHVAGVFDTQTVSAYINGEQIYEVEVPEPRGYRDDSIVIGGNYSDLYNSKRCFDGKIDEVRIYNRSLSLGEISSLYNSNLTRYNTTNWLYKINIPTEGKEKISLSGYIYNKSGNRLNLPERNYFFGIVTYIEGFEGFPWINIMTSNSRVENINRQDIVLEYGKPYVMNMQYLQDLPIGSNNVLNFFGSWEAPSDLVQGEQGSLQIYIKPFYDSKDNFVVE